MKQSVGFLAPVTPPTHSFDFISPASASSTLSAGVFAHPDLVEESPSTSKLKPPDFGISGAPNGTYIGKVFYKTTTVPVYCGVG